MTLILVCVYFSGFFFILSADKKLKIYCDT